MAQGAFGRRAIRRSRKNRPKQVGSYGHANRKPNKPKPTTKPVPKQAPKEQFIPGSATPAKPARKLTLPFLTPEQQAALDASYFQASDELGQYDDRSRAATTDATFNKLMAEEAARQATGKAQDRAAARGMYFSSIKDAQLFDIDAAKQRQIQYQDQIISDLQLGRDSLVHRLYGSGGLVDIAKRLSQGQGVENAKDVESKLPAPKATPATPPKETAASAAARVAFAKRNPAQLKIQAANRQARQSANKQNNVGSSGPATRKKKRHRGAYDAGGATRR